MPEKNELEELRDLICELCNVDNIRHPNIKVVFNVCTCRSYIEDKPIPDSPNSNCRGLTGNVHFLTPTHMKQNASQEYFFSEGYFLGTLSNHEPHITDMYMSRNTRTQREIDTDRDVRSGSMFKATRGLMREFMEGIGPETRHFYEDHVLTQSTKDSHLTTTALRQFYNGHQRYVAGKRAEPPTSYRVDFGPVKHYLGMNEGLIKVMSAMPGASSGVYKIADLLFSFMKKKGITTEASVLNVAWNDRGYSHAQFLGTADYRFKFENDTLHVTVMDSKTKYSLYYHINKKHRYGRDVNPVMGETFQYYHFSITLDEIEERLKIKK